MKVAIFETEHFEAAYPLVRLFDNGQNEIIVFSYASSQRQLAHFLKDTQINIHWITKEENQSRLSFIYTIYREVKKRKIDLLYLNTVSDNFIFYALLVKCLPRTRVILTLHMINNFFTTRHLFSIRRIIRSVGKKMLRNAVKEFNLLSSSMLPLLQEKLDANKKIYNIPGTIFEEGQTNKMPLQTPLKIVIPGSIDIRRRDYEQAFELLQLLEVKNISAHLTFLGNFYGEYGQTVLAKCREWKKDHSNLTWYEGEVIDQPEFDKILSESHFIFTPSVINTMISDDVEETYGISMSSGNIADVIRHAKPFIIPQELAIDQVLKKSCIRYSTSADIISFLLSLQKDPSIYGAFQQSAYNASREFSITNIRNRNAAIFLA